MELYELKNMMMDMATLGATVMMKIQSPGKDNMSQRSAYKEFGEARVKRWVKSGIVRPFRSGEYIKSKIVYSRAELMATDKAEHINQHLTNI